jgi:transcriptional regulator with XRE-family HTH domain
VLFNYYFFLDSGSTNGLPFGKCTGMTERLLISGKRLASLRTERYLTQEELANRLGMSTAGVRRLEQMTFGGMHMRNFRRLAELVELTCEELRSRVGVSRTFESEPARQLIAGQPAALARARAEPVMDVVRFHGVSASRAENRTDVERGRVPVRAGPDRRFAVAVDGDCMEPKYRHGDEVVFSVDAAEREGIVQGRNYFIQFVDGETTFKRIFFDPIEANRLVLRCWNTKYPDRQVERSAIQLLARAEYRLVKDEAEET